AMRGQFPEFEQIAQPTVPDQPQLSKVDGLPGYNPALYDPLQYPVREVDLVGALPKADLEPGRTYRVDALAPLPTLLPPPPGLTATTNPLPAAIATAPAAAARPQPEQTATAPNFAPRATSSAVAQVPTTPASPAMPSPTDPNSPTDTALAADASELFAALPEPTVPTMPLPQSTSAMPAVPIEPQSVPVDVVAMTDVVTVEAAAEPVVETPVAVAVEAATAAMEVAVVETQPVASMDLAMTQHDLIEGYCDRPLAETNEATRLAVCDDDTSE
ncbi:MAG: hypothetical protein AAF827_22120, partial [Cyanobacteria bacterium P01_D01_bin.6]